VASPIKSKNYPYPHGLISTRFLTIKSFMTMKSFLFILSFLAFGTMAAIAQHSNGPVMTFEVTTVDYGTIEKGADPIRKFKFTNTGNEPLIIKSAKGSCGCTVPTYPKEPIMPGESNVVEVRYDTQRVGMFTETVTLATNETTDTPTLTIKGEVKAPPTQESVPLPTGGLNGGN
jgi:hypothetical protein